MDTEFSDADRDKRSGVQWLLAVIAYAELKAGKTWTVLSIFTWRFHPARQHWLKVADLVRDLKYADAPPCKCRFCLPTKKPVASVHDVPTWSGAQIRASRKAAGR